MNTTIVAVTEQNRLNDAREKGIPWKKWGPYLSERQWGTVREDYSENGDAWNYFSHDHARSRAYRWGEDGLGGISDDKQTLCFALCLWNERDPILKERLFGLTNSEGNHGEDAKEYYFYLDSTPTHSYMKFLYKYPQAEFPYQHLVDQNRDRSKFEGEFELIDTGIFDENKYFDVFIEYAKADIEDILIKITIANRGPEAGRLHVLPQLWFRNTWSWGRSGEEYAPKPGLSRQADGSVLAEHATLGRMRFVAGPGPSGQEPELLFTENESNNEQLFGSPNASPYVKDAFHEYVVRGRGEAVNPARTGTKAAALYVLDIPAGRSRAVLLRLCPPNAESLDRAEIDALFAARIAEADEFYARRIPAALGPEERAVSRQAYAGLLWSKQFYHYVVPHWLEGDPAHPAPPPERRSGRNADWVHLYNRDVISMPDKWEYPWYAAWDLAFHMLPFARIDPDFAKGQLELFLREWYMHPNGQIPAYEWALSDVNPPVHAWACWRAYKITGPRGKRDRVEQAVSQAQQKERRRTQRKTQELAKVNRGGARSHHQRQN